MLTISIKLDFGYDRLAKLCRLKSAPDNQVDCCICLHSNDLNGGWTKTNCDHWFHFRCLEHWCKQIRFSLSCPVCRASI